MRLLKIVKGVFIGVIIIILIVIGIFIYDSKDTLYQYVTNIDYSKIEFKDTLNIKSKKSDEYIEFKNIKIRNDFKEIEKETSNDNVYIIKDKEKNSIGINIKDNALYTIGFESGIKEKDYDKFLSDNNITNCTDLLNYAISNKNNKISRLSPKSKINEAVVIRNTLVHFFDIGEYTKDTYLITGEANGVLIKDGNKSLIELIDKDKIYLISINTIKDLNYVIDLISTIVIE